MIRVIRYNITNTDSGMTVLSFLKAKHYSRQCIVELKHHEYGIYLNKERAYVNQTLTSGDEIVITWEDEESSKKIPPVDIELDILYEDEDVIVLNKPSDMPIHPSLNNYDNTLANGLAFYYEKQGNKFVFRCMNRLDRHTSGTVLVAKNGISGAILSEMVRERLIEKEYVALAQGFIDEGICEEINEVYITKDKNYPLAIEAPIGREDDSTIERKVDFENGKRSLTLFRIEDYYKESDASLVSCKLETGRTHQIRVHMKYIGHPLLGDFLYNPKNVMLDRQALHCKRIAFNHPITGKRIEVSAPLPSEWDKIIKTAE